ncbi:hypothetical protein [Adlercreutzia caecimuris]|uniref:hypothetical protein n=1 Tax=Adlercreutzia caecimuris TaxID=671266 RepID=UPI00272C5FBE|nr:hypothetical protein [Adlercreutzia caecimuris]
MADALEKMREFVRGYPGADVLSELDIDWTDAVPGCAGLFPAGLVEVSRKRYIAGGCDVVCQYNFAIYARLAKPPGSDGEAAFNASWVMDFQEWVQAQSARGLAPAFGDDPRSERVQAGGGALYSAADEGSALYMIQISAQFTKRY